MQLECKIGEGEVSTRPGTSTGLEDSESIMRQLQLEQLEDNFPEQSVCDELVDLYFDYLHDKQHSLFHRPSFVADQRKGHAPPMIVAAMMALSARYEAVSLDSDIP
jgi:Fungal specific transcription factor domain